MERHKRGANYFRRIIDNLNRGYEESNWTVETAQCSLDKQLSAIEEIEIELHALLEAKIAGFDDLAQIFKRGKFQILVIDGAMIFSEVDVPALESEKEIASEVLPITGRITEGLGLP